MPWRTSLIDIVIQPKRDWGFVFVVVKKYAISLYPSMMLSSYYSISQDFKVVKYPP